jgi:hypothetical protein
MLSNNTYELLIEMAAQYFSIINILKTSDADDTVQMTFDIDTLEKGDILIKTIKEKDVEVSDDIENTLIDMEYDLEMNSC